FDPTSVKEKSYTVPAVRSEIANNRTALLRFKTAVDHEKLRILTPDNYYLKYVEKAAQMVGDSHTLTEADIQVLALALKLKKKGNNPIVLTDDYSIQNIAKHLGLEFASLATFGIKTLIKWVRYCPACYRKYPENYKAKKCRVCGTELKRKPFKKKNIDKGHRVITNELY
ncbi:hypothetical protein H5T51_06530, partial [Candidatus Bathyarchaeota archaeon]|nr:hypothetical protein [Candidatus Bathyarchaeota archaeon]